MTNPTQAGEFVTVPRKPTQDSAAKGWIINLDYLHQVQTIAEHSFGWRVKYAEQIEAVLLADRQLCPASPAPPAAGEAVDWLHADLAKANAECWSLKERADSLQAEVERLREERDKLTKALTGLTCGGSEFFVRRGDDYIADVKACVEYANRVRTGQHEMIREATLARKAAESRIAVLEEALGPFARADRAIGDEPGPFRFETAKGHRLIEREDLRRARAALEGAGSGWRTDLENAPKHWRPDFAAPLPDAGGGDAA